MDEYVSKKEVVIALLDKGQQTTRYKLGETWELNFSEIKEAIYNMPTTDVEPVRHGRWIIDPGCGEYGRCSECEGKSGTQWDGVEPIPLLTAYCPTCGAKMDKEE